MIVQNVRALPGRSARRPQPSFLARREELRRVRVAGHELGARDPVFDVNGKLDAHAWAVRLGVPHALVLAHVDDVAALPWDTLPQQFVVKPVRGAGSSGVHLLRRDAMGLHDLRRDVPTSAEAVVADLRALVARGKVGSELLVEELVQDPRRPGAGPVDWKFSTFFGRVGVAEAKVAGADGTPSFKLFDAGWQDLGHAYLGGNRVDRSIAPPTHAAELMAMAAHVSACIPRPFVRVDLYDSVDGPVFGEVTPEPGGPPGFRADVDRLLGEHWEEAEARLMVRSARAGLISPADAPLPESALQLRRRPRAALSWHPAVVAPRDGQAEVAGVTAEPIA